MPLFPLYVCLVYSHLHSFTAITPTTTPYLASQHLQSHLDLQIQLKSGLCLCTARFSAFLWQYWSQYHLAWSCWLALFVDANSIMPKCCGIRLDVNLSLPLTGSVTLNKFLTFSKSWFLWQEAALHEWEKSTHWGFRGLMLGVNSSQACDLVGLSSLVCKIRWLGE